MAARKLQGEIDRTLKRIAEGVEAFEESYQKLVATAAPAQKEKIVEGELKTNIKKLQRLRDQLKTWLASNEIKDKKALTDNRKLIETQMEKFKACEKEMKTKAFSKEGLSANQKLDPKEQLKAETSLFVANMVDELARQVETTEAEIEQLQGGAKKSKKSTGGAEKVSTLEELNERRQWHIGRLELINRLIENGNLDADRIQGLREDISYFVESNTEEDFEEDEGIYDELNLDDEEEAFGMADKDDIQSSHDSMSIADTSEVLSHAPSRTPAKPKPTPVKEEEPAEKSPTTTKAKRKPTLDSTTQRPSISGPTRSTSSSQPSAATPSTPAPPVPTPRAPTQLPPIRYSAAAASAVAQPPPSASQAAPASAASVVSPPPAAAHVQSPPATSSAPAAPAAAASPEVTKASLPPSQSVPASAEPSEVAPSPSPSHASVPQQSLLPLSGTAGPSPAVQSRGPTGQAEAAPSPASQAAVPPQSDGALPTRDAQPSPNMQTPSATGQLKLPSSLADLVTSFESAKLKAQQQAPDLAATQDILEAGFPNIPQPADAERPKYYIPRNPFPTPPYYPQTPSPHLANPALIAKFDVDTLFYIFYYCQGTYMQYLAAQELKKQSWRFHKQYLTWFQRANEPQSITDEYEQGTYLYFDFEGTWAQRRKENFSFFYRHLEE